MKIKTIFIIIILMSGMLFSSCRSGRMSQAQKYAYNSEEQLKEENDKMVEEYREYHYGIQADETQKMMDKSKKRAKKLRKKKKESFVDRVFRRKKSSSCNGN